MKPVSQVIDELVQDKAKKDKKWDVFNQFLKGEINHDEALERIGQTTFKAKE